MQFGVIFLALFFLAISHVQCAPDDDLKNVKVVAIPYRVTSGGETEVLLVTMNDGKNKGPMFVRGHVKEREARRPDLAALRETEEETGYKGVAMNSGGSFETEHPTKGFMITMHPYTVKIPAGATPESGPDTGNRKYEWVSPSEVGDRIRKEEMLAAWSRLGHIL